MVASEMRASAVEGYDDAALDRRPTMPCRDDVDDDGWIVNFEWDSIVATNFHGGQGRRGWSYVL